MTTGMKHLAAYQANLLDYNAAKDREGGLEPDHSN